MKSLRKNDGVSAEVARGELGSTARTCEEGAEGMWRYLGAVGRRCVLLGFLMTLVVAICLALHSLTPGLTGLTSHALDDLYPGMTRGEVERRLGSAGVDYWDSPGYYEGDSLINLARFSHELRLWENNRGTLAVQFDAKGKVVSAHFVENPLAYHSLIDCWVHTMFHEGSPTSGGTAVNQDP
jgi:hypothetical protein